MTHFEIARLSDAPLHTSRITCECKTWQLRKNHRTGGLLVFRGVYPPGSAGADDARYIRWLLSEFYAMHHPDGLVVDCRELDYVWGDDLSFPAPEATKADRCPLLIVLRPEQQDAFDYAVSRSEQRLDLEQALAEVDEEVRDMKPLL